MTELDHDAQKQLLADCWAKKKGAWEKFLGQYSRLIYYSISRTCRMKSYPATPEEIEDLFNDFFVQILKDDCRKLRQFRGERGCSAATWLRTMAVRQVLDHIRRSGRTYLRVDFEAEEEATEGMFGEPVPSPEEILLAREREHVVARAIAELSEDDRRFVELYYAREMAPEDIARSLRVTVSTVYSKVNRLKSKIGDQIAGNARKAP